MAFGPKDPIIYGFWAVLMLRARGGIPEFEPRGRLQEAGAPWSRAFRV